MNKERETIIVIAIMAIMGAIGGVAFICRLFDVDVLRVGLASLTGFVVGIGGIIFAFLMMGNLD